jgi:hypothetical protein
MEYPESPSHWMVDLTKQSDFLLILLCNPREFALFAQNLLHESGRGDWD